MSEPHEARILADGVDLSEESEHPSDSGLVHICGKRLIIGASVLVALAVIAGCMWAWHERPDFCNAVCHVPMDSYVEGYYSEDPMLLASVHAKANVSCLDCHEPTIAQQVGEVVSWAAGGYEVPLEQRRFDDGFCLNESCHDTDRDGLAEATDHIRYNPHADHHERLECGECHKVHAQSVLECGSCHCDADVPDNWTVPKIIG